MKTIGVLASSSPVKPELLQAGISFWEQRGYQIQLSPNLYASDRFLAGSDEQRIADLHSLFTDDSIDIILQAGGGYGSARLLKSIDYDLIANNKKPFIGLSDTTALQLALLKKSNLISYSGYLLKQRFSKPIMPYTEQSLFDCLMNNKQTFFNLHSTYQGKDISGKLIGGCLTLIISLIGTPYMPDLTDSILVVEDVSEQPYVIDRMLSQLENAGVFQQIKALLFGNFHDCNSVDSSDGTIENVVTEWKNRLDIPVFSNLPYGHQSDTAVLPIGGQAILNKECLRVRI